MISIIIATYNRANFLPRSIDSILAQTYADWELLVVDDGSTDQTEKLFENHYKDSRIQYIKLNENKGATFARNHGLDLLKGDYFLVWDSDDILYPEALARVREVFDQYQGLAVVSAPTQTTKEGRGISYPIVPTGLLSYEDVVCRILPPSNDKVKLINSKLCGDIRYKAKNIDFLVNVECGERGGWWHINEYLGEVYSEADAISLTSARKKPNVAASKLRSDYLQEYLLRHGSLMKQRNPKQYAAFAYGTSVGLLLKGERGQALILARDSALYSGGRLKYWLWRYFAALPLARRVLVILFRLKSSIHHSRS